MSPTERKLTFFKKVSACRRLLNYFDFCYKTNETEGWSVGISIFILVFAASANIGHRDDYHHPTTSVRWPAAVCGPVVPSVVKQFTEFLTLIILRGSPAAMVKEYRLNPRSSLLRIVQMHKRFLLRCTRYSTIVPCPPPLSLSLSPPSHTHTMG